MEYQFDFHAGVRRLKTIENYKPSAQKVVVHDC